MLIKTLKPLVAFFILSILFITDTTAQRWQYTETNEINGLRNITVRYDYWFEGWALHVNVTDLTIGNYTAPGIPADKKVEFNKYLVENGIRFPMNMSETSYDFGLTMTGVMSRGFGTKAAEKKDFSLGLMKGTANWTSKEPSAALKKIADDYYKVHRVDYIPKLSDIDVTTVKMSGYRLSGLLNKLQSLEQSFLNNIAANDKQFARLLEDAVNHLNNEDISSAASLLSQAEKLISNSAQRESYRQAKAKHDSVKRELAANTQKAGNLVDRAKALIRQEKPEEATALLQEAVALNPEARVLDQIAALEKELIAKAGEQQKKQTTAAGSGGTAGKATLKEEKAISSEEAKASEKETRKSTTSSQKTYVPKTATERHRELQRMVAETPGMMNDPKIRQQLRHLEVDAKREQETYRQYRAGAYNHSNYQAIGVQMQTEQRIDNYTKAVGDLTDAATGLVNSIIAESERKQAQRRADIQAGIDRYYAKKEALNNYSEQIRNKRFAYEKSVKEELEKYYDDVHSVSSAPLYYETEVEDRESNDPHAFKKARLELSKSYAYIVREGEQYGLAGDDGRLIYPPQFEGIVPFRAYNGIRPQAHFIVNIKDKWGEIDADGKIIEEIKYDGIWYTRDHAKLKNYANQWKYDLPDGTSFIKNTKELADNFVLLINDNKKGYSYDVGLAKGFYLMDFNRNTSLVSVYPDNAGNRIKYIQGYEVNAPASMTEQNKYSGILFKKDTKWYMAVLYTTEDGLLSAHHPMSETFVIPVQNGAKQWGAINERGETVIPFTHKYLKDFENGKAASDKGVYNMDGTLAFANAYEYLSAFDRGVALYKVTVNYKTEIGLVEENGKEHSRIRAYSDDTNNWWLRLGNHYSKDKEQDPRIALYCYDKVEKGARDYGFANLFAGDIYNFKLKDDDKSTEYYLKAANAPEWQYYLENMQARSWSKQQSVYELKYFSEVVQYHRLLTALALKFFGVSDKYKSLENANSVSGKAVIIGQEIISTFVNDFPSDRNKKSVDLSWVYLRTGMAYEMLGNLKEAKKYYNLSRKRKTADVVEAADRRLKALKEGKQLKYVEG